MRTVLVVAVTLCTATTAAAQDRPPIASSCGELPASLGSGTLHGITTLPRGASAAILAAGAAAALGAHAADDNVSGAVSSRRTVHGLFQPGALLGSMPFEAGAAVATMAIGRVSKHPCTTRLGMELLQAQLVGAVWTIGIKEASRRSRPEGTGFSFPSGHTVAAFASATVLQRRFGWKVGLPAYAVASYVGASRIEMRRHYLSDVAFAAALGVIAGRSINVGHGHALDVSPLAAPRGGGVAFTWR